MTSNAIDYYATLGKEDGPFRPKEFQSPHAGDRTVFTANEIWNAAITDVIIVGKENESLLLDGTWTTIIQSAEGEPLDPPHIAFRRRKFSKRPDHITEVI